MKKLNLVLEKLDSMSIDYILTELTDGTVITFFGEITEEEIEMFEKLCGKYFFGFGACDFNDLINKRQLNTLYISNKKINNYVYNDQKGSMLSFKDNEIDFYSLQPIYINNLIRLINKYY